MKILLFSFIISSYLGLALAVCLRFYQEKILSNHVFWAFLFPAIHFVILPYHLASIIISRNGISFKVIRLIIRLILFVLWNFPILISIYSKNLKQEEMCNSKDNHSELDNIHADYINYFNSYSKHLPGVC